MFARVRGFALIAKIELGEDFATGFGAYQLFALIAKTSSGLIFATVFGAAK